MGVRTGSAERTTPWETFTSEGWMSVGPSTIWMIWTSWSRRPEAGLRPAEGEGPPRPLPLLPDPPASAVITQQQPPSPFSTNHHHHLHCHHPCLVTAFIMTGWETLGGAATTMHYIEGSHQALSSTQGTSSLSGIHVLLCELNVCK